MKAAFSFLQKCDVHSSWACIVRQEEIRDEKDYGRFGLVLQENTPGKDKLRIDKSVLSGVYMPVPIPPSGLLVGSALSGLFFLRGKRQGVRI